MTTVSIFEKLRQLYHRALENDPDEIAICRELGKEGSAAGRARFSDGAQKSDVSNFGTVRPRTLAREAAAAEDMAMMMDLDARQAATKQATGNNELQIVLASSHDMDAISEVVCSWAGTDVKDQLQRLDRLCRAHSRAQAAKDNEERAAVKGFVRSHKDIHGLPWDRLDLPESGTLRFVPGSPSLLSWYDPCIALARSKVAQLTKRNMGSTASTFEEWLQRNSRMLCKSEIGDVDVHESWKPTYCYKFGGGECLCTGENVVVDIMRRKSTAAVLLLCRFGTAARSLLTNGWLCALYQNEHWYHIGLVYLNPQRFTYLKMEHVLTVPASGEVTLGVELVDGEAECFTDVEAMAALDPTLQAEVKLYKLTSHPCQPLIPFSLGNLVNVEPLELNGGAPIDNMRWWLGRDLELVEEINRRKKANQERAAKAAKSKPEAKHAPRPPRLSRSAQKPPNAGLPVPRASLLAPIADAAAAAPGAHHGEVRLGVDGMEDDAEAPTEAPLDVGDDDQVAVPGGDQFLDSWEDAVEHADVEDDDAPGAAPAGHIRNYEF